MITKEEKQFSQRVGWVEGWIMWKICPTLFLLLWVLQQTGVPITNFWVFSPLFLLAPVSLLISIVIGAFARPLCQAKEVYEKARLEALFGNLPDEPSPLPKRSA